MLRDIWSKECLTNIENCAKSATYRYWDQCKYIGGSTKRMGKLSCAFEKADENVAYSYGAMSFHSRAGSSFLNSHQLDGAVTLKGSHSIGDRRIFLKISAPNSLMTTNRMNLIWAGSISLNSTFKGTVFPYFSFPLWALTSQQLGLYKVF
jgi:hypothetical protein